MDYPCRVMHILMLRNHKSWLLQMLRINPCLYKIRFAHRYLLVRNLPP
jgi:hypothetical protein